MAESTFQKSFIPKPESQKFSSGGSLANTLGGGIFVIVLLLALGIFLYNQYIENSIKTLTEEISITAENINEVELEEMAAFQARLETVNSLLNGHIASSRLLDLVGETTLTNVQFDSFIFESRNGSNALVTIKGTAPDFRSVAAQVGVLRANNKFTEALVTELNVVQTEVSDVIDFGIEAEVERSVISYEPQSISVLNDAVDPIEDTLDDMEANNETN